MPAPLGDRLAGRVILITGAGGCLGGVAARACAAEGARVILLDRVVERIEKAYDDIVAAGAPEPALYPLDLGGATEADYAELAQAIEHHFGALHGLLHSAAELGIPGPLADIDIANWQRVLHVNLGAAHMLTRALLPLLIRSGDAAVVFTSDSAVGDGKAYWGAYGIAKVALEGLARMWAAELQSGGKVRVELLTPGPLRSAMRRRSHPGELPEMLPEPDTLTATYIRLLGPHALQTAAL